MFSAEYLLLLLLYKFFRWRLGLLRLSSSVLLNLLSLALIPSMAASFMFSVLFSKQFDRVMLLPAVMSGGGVFRPLSKLGAEWVWETQSFGDGVFGLEEFWSDGLGVVVLPKLGTNSLAVAFSWAPEIRKLLFWVEKGAIIHINWLIWISYIFHTNISFSRRSEILFIRRSGCWLQLSPAIASYVLNK